MLTQEKLKIYVKYDKHTGEFVWATRPSSMFSESENRTKEHVSAMWNGRYAETKCGCISNTGHVHICIDRVEYLAHRLAWLYEHGEWPDKNIDHINGDPSDNRIENLRLSNQSQNGGNSKMPKNNTSGFKGVSWCKLRDKWKSYIKVSRKYIHLGYFDCPAAASFAYQIAADIHFGDFARTA